MGLAKGTLLRGTKLVPREAPEPPTLADAGIDTHLATEAMMRSPDGALRNFLLALDTLLAVHGEAMTERSVVTLTRRPGLLTLLEADGGLDLALAHASITARLSLRTRDGAVLSLFARPSAIRVKRLQ